MVRVAVVVHPHAGRASALVDEVRRHLGHEPTMVWSGDPTLRPLGPGGTAWGDLGVVGPVGGLSPGLAWVMAHPSAYGIARALSVEPVAHTLVLDGRWAAVTGPCAVPAGSLGVVRREAAVDGRSPSIADLAREGPFGPAAVSVPAADAALFAARLIDAGPAAPAGAAVAAAVGGRSTTPLPGLAVGWEPDPSVDAAHLLDLSSLAPDEPWWVAVGEGPARTLLSEHPALAAVARDLEPGAGDPPRLRGGPPADATVARLVADAVERWRRGAGELPPDPWDDATGFLAWLESPGHPWEPAIGRYWYGLWQARPDLQHVFPDPAGADLHRFRDWADDRHRHEPHSPVLRSGRRRAPVWRDGGRAGGGVDLIGYFGTEVSLTNLTRRVQSALEAAGIAHTTNDFRRSGSPRLDRPPATDDELRHDTAIAIVNPDQVPALLAEQGGVLAGRRLIGYWHWDVEHVPDHVAARMSHFDQIWVLNEWTQRSLAAAGPGPPVRSLPVRVPEPEPSSASRHDLGLPADRFVFLVTFDHLSVTERKHPVGAIEAFRRAFPDPLDDGPLLVVKTMNADQRWVEHERVRLAAGDRPDIVVVDRRLPLGDQMALIAHADCLVSLHRSEGLGLHLVEAMWLGTPTIATRYSGNLSFMDDTNSLLVDATMVSVERGEGLFPPEATWADPDLDQAAQLLRRVVDDADLRRRLAAAARERMERQPTFDETGRTIAAWCEIGPR